MAKHSTEEVQNVLETPLRSTSPNDVQNERNNSTFGNYIHQRQQSDVTDIKQDAKSTLDNVRQTIDKNSIEMHTPQLHPNSFVLPESNSKANETVIKEVIDFISESFALSQNKDPMDDDEIAAAVAEKFGLDKKQYQQFLK